MHAISILLLLVLAVIAAVHLRRYLPESRELGQGLKRFRWWMSLVTAVALVVTVVVATVVSTPVAPERFMISLARAERTTLPAAGAQPGQLLVRMMLLRASGAHWVPVACRERLVDARDPITVALDAPANRGRALLGGERVHAELSFPALDTLPGGPAGLDAAQGQLRCTDQRGLTEHASDLSPISLNQMLDAHHGWLHDLNWQDAQLMFNEQLAVLPSHERGDLAVYLSAQLLDAGAPLQHQELTSAWIDARTPPLGVFNDTVPSSADEPAGFTLLRHLHLAGLALLVAAGLLARCSPHPYRTAVVGAFTAMLLTIALERIMIAKDLQLVHDPAISAPQRAQAIAQAHGTYFYRQLVARELPPPSMPR